MIRERKKNAGTVYSVTILLFVIGCVAEKIMMICASDTWITFNSPVIGILAIGEWKWWRTSKK